FPVLRQRPPSLLQRLGRSSPVLRHQPARHRRRRAEEGSGAVTGTCWWGFPRRTRSPDQPFSPVCGSGKQRSRTSAPAHASCWSAARLTSEQTSARAWSCPIRSRRQFPTNRSAPR
ncbi:unnamed protein product, partial [Tetraodon nigroviridis]